MNVHKNQNVLGAFWINVRPMISSWLLLASFPFFPAGLVAQAVDGETSATLPNDRPKDNPIGDYDPLRVSNSGVRTVLLDVIDKASNREIPIKVYLPGDMDTPAPVILFSHGLGGDRESCLYLGTHWAGRGYLSVFLQNPGSDDSVWKDAPRRERMRNMGQAANFENMQLRFRDVSAVLDQLEKWNHQADHELGGRCNLKKIGMSGHSFGAVTTQGVSGQTLMGRARSTDPRIKAAVIFSPSAPRAGTPENAFRNVQLPWLLITGTEDVAPIGNVSMQNRLSVFPALPADGTKYQLVLHGAEHSAFTDRALPGDRNNRNPNHHRSLVGITTSFWDAYLKENLQAKAYLHDPDGIRSLLEMNDRWEYK